MTYRIAVLVGSLRRDSFNRHLAQALAKLAPQHRRGRFLEQLHRAPHLRE